MEHAINPSATRALFALVTEFLQFHDFPITLEAFEAERSAKRASMSLIGSVAGLPLTGKARTLVVNDMMHRFDTGAEEEFFAMWARFVPASFQQHDDWTKKLEFGLRVHFAIWPILQSTGESVDRLAVAARMKAFKHYLETRGAALARQGAFLSYYALPYVLEPEAHPSFSHLFAPDCVVEQRLQLETFLMAVPGAVTLPQLYALYQATREQQDPLPPVPSSMPRTTDVLDSSRDLESYVTEALGPPEGGPPESGPTASASAVDAPADSVAYRLRLSAAAEDALRSGGAAPMLDELVDAAWTPPPRELTECLQPGEVAGEWSGTPRSASPGAQADEGPPLLQSDEPALPAGVVPQPVPAAGEERGEEPGAARTERAVSLRRTVLQQALLPALDAAAFKADLLSGDASLVARLLQAVRWRLTRSPAGFERRRVMATIIDADLLLCTTAKAPADCGIGVCARLRSSDVDSQLAWLLNAIASDSAGRSYLLQPASEALKVLHEILIAKKTRKPPKNSGDGTVDTPDHRQALAALQKLSLRRCAQSYLIDQGMVAWLKGFMSDPDALSEYAVEYGMALLMNLCLRRRGRAACESLNILELLDLLIQSSNPQVRTYVHGTLYSALSRRTILEQARACGLEHMLRAVSSASEPTFQRQISYILTKLQAPPAASPADDDAESDDGLDEQEDMFEDGVEYDEDDADDDDQSTFTGQARGEELLCAYLASTQIAVCEAERLKKSVAPARLRGFNAEAAASSHASSIIDDGGQFLQRPCTPSGRTVGKTARILS